VCCSRIILTHITTPLKNEQEKKEERRRKEKRKKKKKRKSFFFNLVIRDMTHMLHAAHGISVDGKMYI
jgi:hypothetical protein